MTHPHRTALPNGLGSQGGVVESTCSDIKGHLGWEMGTQSASSTCCLRKEGTEVGLRSGLKSSPET